MIVGTRGLRPHGDGACGGAVGARSRSAQQARRRARRFAALACAARPPYRLTPPPPCPLTARRRAARDAQRPGVAQPGGRQDGGRQERRCGATRGGGGALLGAGCSAPLHAAAAAAAGAARVRRAQPAPPPCRELRTAAAAPAVAAAGAGRALVTSARRPPNLRQPPWLAAAAQQLRITKRRGRWPDSLSLTCCGNVCAPPSVPNLLRPIPCALCTRPCAPHTVCPPPDVTGLHWKRLRRRPAPSPSLTTCLPPNLVLPTPCAPPPRCHRPPLDQDRRARLPAGCDAQGGRDRQLCGIQGQGV